jgi:predicted DCC family thiol-disulfide oxidoreductase YuxK
MHAVPELTLYFDGHCPFCTAEMGRLRKWNKAGRLAFVDISVVDFDPVPLGVDMAALDRELHSRTADGRLLVGIDSMLAAYTLVGRAWLVFPLRVRWLRPLLAWLYRGFARHRYRFSRWLGYKPVARCEHDVCQPLNPFFRGR